MVLTADSFGKQLARILRLRAEGARFRLCVHIVWMLLYQSIRAGSIFAGVMLAAFAALNAALLPNRSRMDWYAAAGESAGDCGLTFAAVGLCVTAWVLVTRLRRP